jgi:hypothetical protein
MSRAQADHDLLQVAKFDAFSVHHTYFFSPRNLVRLVEAAGFVMERISTSIAPFPSTNESLKRKLFEVVLQFANRYHPGGDIIELWARQPQ